MKIGEARIKNREPKLVPMKIGETRTENQETRVKNREVRARVCPDAYQRN